MLQVRNLSYTYPGGKTTLTGIDASISSGVTLIVGPNAGGKTTFLRILAGLLEPQSGYCTDTSDHTRLLPADLRRLSRMVMQDAELQILGTTVGEDIQLGQAASTLGEHFTVEAQRLAHRFKIADLWNQPVDILSYGQKRKLCLIHALLAGPKVLLLDEPFAGLDYPSALELRGFIRENAHAGLAQVISTHELEPVIDLADRLVVVKDGCIAAQGKPEDLLSRLQEWSVRQPSGGWN